MRIISFDIYRLHFTLRETKRTFSVVEVKVLSPIDLQLSEALTSLGYKLFRNIVFLYYGG